MSFTQRPAENPPHWQLRVVLPPVLQRALSGDASVPYRAISPAMSLPLTG